MAGDIVFKTDLDDTKAMNKINKLKTKLAELQTERKTKSGLIEEIDAYNTKISEAIQKMKILRSSGETKKADSMRGKIAELQAGRTVSLGKAEQYGGYDALKAQLSGLDSQIDKTEGKIGSLQKAQASLARNGMEGLNNGMKKGVLAFLKYGIGIRSLFALFNRLRSVIQDGIANMAKYDKETRNSLIGIKSSMAELKGNFTSVFAGLLNSLAPVIQTIINWLSTAISKVAEFFAALSGKGTFKRAVANTGAIASNLDGAASGAKEAKKQLAGFDELNVLQDNTSGGGGGGGASDVMYEEVPVELTPTMEKLKTIFEEIWGIIKNIWKETEPIREFIGDVLLTVIETVVDLLYDISELLSGNISFQEFIDNLSPLETVILGIATAIGVVKAYNFISGLITNIPLLMGKISGLLAMITPTELIIGAIVAAIVLLLKYGDIVAAWLENIRKIVDDWIDNIQKVVNEFIQRILDKLTETNSVIDGIFAQLFSIVQIAWNTIIGVVKTAWDLIVFVLSSISTAIRAFATGDWKGAWDKIKNVWSDVLDGMKNSGRTILNSIIGLFENFVNTIINGVNRVLQAINAVGSWFGASWQLSINHVSLPRLATGGIVDRATPFIAGEAGKEAVIPLERNTEWITLVADGLIDRLLDNSVINRVATAFMSVPMPAMAMGGIVPPRASGSYSMFSDEDIGRIISGLQDAVREMSRQPIVVDSKLYLDRKQVGSAVTEYQREQNRRNGG